MRNPARGASSERDDIMTVQLIILGTRRPESDDDYAAYGSVAGADHDGSRRHLHRPVHAHR